MLIRFHVLERLADFVDLVDLVDRQLQLARFDRAPDVFSDFLEDLPDLLDGAGAEGAPISSALTANYRYITIVP